jgi:hypothetical protein
MKKLLKHLIPGLLCLEALLTQAQPLLPAQLQLRVTLQLAADLGIAGNSTFNPRFFDGFAYANQISTPGFGRYPSGSGIPSVVVNNTATPLEHRMVAPFRGAYASTYMLGSSMGLAPGTTTLSRYDFDGSNRVDANTPDNQAAEGFDWVDEDTVIFAVYNPSGSRKRLYLADVVAHPFSVARNTTWNGDGYITTSVGTRIRNVRVGDVYHDYAYYGDGNQNTSPSFYALHLPTGTETWLGNAGLLTGSGSFGVWTVLERGGYLYVQTTDNGIQVYEMIDATTIGSLYTTYAKADLDAITGYTGQCYGLDVTPNGAQMLLGAAGGLVFELGSPVLSIARSGTDVILSWPATVNAVAIQATLGFSPASFADLDPQPAVQVSGKFNTATLSAAEGHSFFRLRKTP